MISLLLPVRNESSLIEEALQALPLAGTDAEVLVIDDHSTDDTVQRACRHARVIPSSGRGRGAAFDAGAQAARGETLLLLHADTRLPSDALQAVAQALQDPRVAGGAFSRRYEDPRWRYRFLEWRADLDTRLTGVFLGNQGLFCRRADYLAAGGCRGLPLFEDIDLCRRLRERGRLVQLPQVARLSPRRYERKGLLKSTLLNYLLTLGYYAGISPQRLWETYYGEPWRG